MYVGKPYFYEYNGRIFNLSAASKFYVDHLPGSHWYWPCARIGGESYYLSDALSTEREALDFIRDLTKKIADNNQNLNNLQNIHEERKKK
jgi:maltose-binding protein MalE